MIDSGDSNFYVINNKKSWSQGLFYHVQTADEGIKIEEIKEYVKEYDSGGAGFPEGLAIKDFCGSHLPLVHLLDQHGRVWTYDLNLKYTERIECIQNLFNQPLSIASASRNIYISDPPEKKIFAIAKLNWQIRWVVDGMFALDLTSDHEGNLYALTVCGTLDEKDTIIPAGTLMAVIKIDQAGIVVKDFEAQFKLTNSVPMPWVKKSLFIQTVEDGSVYILDADSKKILKFFADGKEHWEFDEWTVFPDLPSGFGVDSAGNIYLGEGQKDDKGNFIYKYNSSGSYLGVVTCFRGQIDRLIMDKNDRIYIYNRDYPEITLLKPVLSIYRNRNNLLPAGSFYTAALQNTSLEMTWHKIVLDRDIPENTQILIYHLVSDEKEFMIDGNLVNLDSFIRSTSILSDDQKALRIKSLNNLNWSKPLVNPEDALIHSTSGRYLWLRIELIGSETKTPLLKSIRVDFPRQSYLTYLPSVYQENEQSRDFLERFLSLFKTFYSANEHQIGHLEKYFDADVASGDFLRWLGCWLAVAADENWEEEKVRRLIKKAPRLYKKRGTREGIQEILKIYTGEKPFVIEQFQLKCEATEKYYEDLLNRLYGTDPYEFCILLKPFLVKSVSERSTVKNIVDSEKPAYTSANVIILEPWINLDLYTYIGVNTYLSKPSPRLDGQSVMPRDTVLSDFKEAGQVERRSRISEDTYLT